MLQAGYTQCPLTGHSYDDITETAINAITRVIQSVSNSILNGDIGRNRIPTVNEKGSMQLFGRCMQEWTLGYYLMSPEAMDKHSVRLNYHSL